MDGKTIIEQMRRRKPEEYAAYLRGMSATELAAAKAYLDAEPKLEIEVCLVCGGDGLMVVGWDSDAYENIEGTCAACGGTGYKAGRA